MLFCFFPIFTFSLVYFPLIPFLFVSPSINQIKIFQQKTNVETLLFKHYERR